MSSNSSLHVYPDVDSPSSALRPPLGGIPMTERSNSNVTPAFAPDCPVSAVTGGAPAPSVPMPAPDGDEVAPESDAPTQDDENLRIERAVAEAALRMDKGEFVTFKELTGKNLTTEMRDHIFYKLWLGEYDTEAERLSELFCQRLLQESPTSYSLQREARQPLAVQKALCNKLQTKAQTLSKEIAEKSTEQEVVQERLAATFKELADANEQYGDARAKMAMAKTFVLTAVHEKQVLEAAKQEQLAAQAAAGRDGRLELEVAREERSAAERERDEASASALAAAEQVRRLLRATQHREQVVMRHRQALVSMQSELAAAGSAVDEEMNLLALE